MDGALTAGRWRALVEITFLELLAREAAAVEFERPVLEARAEGWPPAELAELEQAKAAALRVRALLERRRRREAELTALFDTVGDLATLRDLNAVLEAIVRRARKLLNADLAYMTLNDEQRGDTYMRVTDGSVSAHFQQLRLPLGAGLGGLVAQTASPYLTADYLEDPRFRHTGDIDGAVHEEGIVAILGVPLKLGGRVLGVLFAANRTARPFTREDVDLLGSLAAHAAVALDNTRLLGETRAALEELSAANIVVRRHSESIERGADAHDQMTDLVLRGGNLQDLARVVTELLDGDLAIFDGDGHELASVGDLGPPAEGAIGSVRSPGRAARHGDHWVVAVSAGTGTLCTLVLHRAGELGATDRRILERAGVVTALLLLFRRSVAEAESRVRGELLDDLLSRPVDDPAVVRERARRLGVDLDAPHVLVVLHCAQRYRLRAASWAAGRPGLAASRDGSLVMLLPGDDPGSPAKRLAKELAAYLGAPATAGGAGPVTPLGPETGPAAVVAAYREAQRCASALLALGREGDGASATDLGFVGLLLSADRDVDGFVTATLGPLLDYDTRRGTALLRTLEAYYETGGSISRVAEAMHIHVNTVTQRLGRIGQLLGADWQQPARALELQLAVRLYRLAH